MAVCKSLKMDPSKTSLFKRILSIVLKLKILSLLCTSGLSACIALADL